MAGLVRGDVRDRTGWGTDVHRALQDAGQPVTRDTACQVLAIIEQESGYEADPMVPHLGRVVKGEVDAVFGRLGPAAHPIRRALLQQTADGTTRTFEQRLTGVQTEQQADRLYREIVDFHLARHPAARRAMRLLAPGFVEDHNPITTAGSMQVSVRWAIAAGATEGRSPVAVRDSLYTRRGGVKYGTERLFAHEADYPDPRYRFADYNAGVWASRNAAVQAMASNLTGIDIALDGDVLRYDDDGVPRREPSNTLRVLLAVAAAHPDQLSDRQVRRDARLEKTARFDETDTVRVVRETWSRKHGRDWPYAWMPIVQLTSPKMSPGRTTQWFADNVDRRYKACLERGRR
ncbi:MAG: DUF1615 family protein [Myxococcota bacterium]|nr:DUF1615 family protein [Myxococcota bacterium]